MGGNGVSEHGATDAEFSGFAVEPNRSRPITCVYNDGPLGIYRTADVEALIGVVEALNGRRCDGDLAGAVAAITPELLARCRTGERG